MSWAAVELGGANLGDARLNRRLVRVAERLGAQPGASIPVACGGWAETQGAYRLLAHEAVCDEPADGLAHGGAADPEARRLLDLADDGAGCEHAALDLFEQRRIGSVTRAHGHPLFE